MSDKSKSQARHLSESLRVAAGRADAAALRALLPQPFAPDPSASAWSRLASMAAWRMSGPARLAMAACRDGGSGDGPHEHATP